MRDIMVDLETLGQTPGCVILSIGAVAFDQFGLGEEFYCVVNTADSLKAGLFEEESTKEWWAKQAVEAKAVLAEAKNKKSSVPLRTAMLLLEEYLHKVGSPSQLRIHGNGSDFDNAILSAANYRAFKGEKELPWKFWNNRCHRTNKGKGERGLEPKREGTYHNALDDAKHQARHAIALHKAGVRIFC